MPEDKLLKQAAPGLNAEDSSKKFYRRDTRDIPAQDQTGDARTSPRHAVSASADVVEPQTHTRLAGRVTDLSMGGCYVDAISPFEAGTDVHLRLVSENRVFLAQAHVLYATPGLGMGLAFTKMTPEHLEILSEWMRVLAREVHAPEPAGETVFDFDAPAESPAPAQDLHAIVADLVMLLARKHILTEYEADEMRKKLLRDTP